MKRFKNHLIAAAVLSVLAIIGTIMNSRPSVLQAAAGPTVTIDPTQLPLPVQGSTSVSGTVAATQSGTWNVGIAGNSASSPLFTRDADNPARRPFQTSLCSSILETPEPCNAPSSFTVPSNLRLIIEFIGGSCATPLGNNGLQELDLGIRTQVGGTDATYSFPYSFGLGELTIAQQTRIYADPGTNVFLFVGGGGGGTAFATCTLALSGYMVTP
jgi:hypothetical protein